MICLPENGQSPSRYIFIKEHFLPLLILFTYPLFFFHISYIYILFFKINRINDDDDMVWKVWIIIHNLFTIKVITRLTQLIHQT